MSTTKKTPSAAQLEARAKFTKMVKEKAAAKKKGLKAPATKGLTTLCAKAIGTTGRRKKDGTLKKGYVAKKGGKVVATKKKVVKKK